MRAGPRAPAENHDNEKLNGLFLAQLQEVGGELSNARLKLSNDVSNYNYTTITNKLKRMGNIYSC